MRTVHLPYVPGLASTLLFRLARWLLSDHVAQHMLNMHTHAHLAHALKQVGTYNPLATKSGVKEVTFKVERIRYWISVGAQPSDRVAWLLGQVGIEQQSHLLRLWYSLLWLLLDELLSRSVFACPQHFPKCRLALLSLPLVITRQDWTCFWNTETSSAVYAASMPLLSTRPNHLECRHSTHFCRSSHTLFLPYTSSAMSPFAEGWCRKALAL